MEEKDEKKKFSDEIEESILRSAKSADFPLWRRSHWDEWGSPVGLALCGAISLISVGLFLWLLHLAGLV